RDDEIASVVFDDPMPLVGQVRLDFDNGKPHLGFEDAALFQQIASLQKEVHEGRSPKAITASRRRALDDGHARTALPKRAGSNSGKASSVWPATIALASARHAPSAG